jgi:hypothetical protein
MRVSRRSTVLGGLAALATRKAHGRMFGGRGGSVNSAPPPNTLPLARRINNSSAVNTNTLSSAFWLMGHPFIKGEVPSGNIVTATLGGTSIPVQGFSSLLESDGSLAWTVLAADLTGISISAGGSADLELTSTVGSWGATSRTNADWIALADTVEITSLSTTGTAGVTDMDGAGTWTATFDGSGTNTVLDLGTGPLGLFARVQVPFINATAVPPIAISSITWSAGVATVTTASPHGIAASVIFTAYISGATPAGYNGVVEGTRTGTSTFTYPLATNPAGSASSGTFQQCHRFLRAWMYYFVFQKSDTTLGSVSSLGPFIENIRVFKTNPSEFDYVVAWKRNAASQRSMQVNHVGMTFAALVRADGQWDWTANDPGVWISQDYTKLGATMKFPRWGDGISYVGDLTIDPSTPATVTGGNPIITVGTASNLFGPDFQPVAVDIFATSMPGGLTAGSVYWAKRLAGGITINLYDSQAHAAAGGTTGKITPSTAGSGVAVRLSVGPMSPGKYAQTMENAGGRPDIGLHTEWATAAVVASSSAEGYKRKARVMAYVHSGIPGFVIDDSTGKIPSLLNSTGAFPTPAGLTTKVTTYWKSGTFFSSDIGGGSGPTGGRNNWTEEASHWPSGIYVSWALEGNPFLRDMLILDGNRAIGGRTYLPQRTFLTASTTYYGTIFFNWSGINIRTGAWNMRDVLHAAFAAYEGSPEKTYYQRILDSNMTQGIAYVAFKGSNYSTIGLLYMNEKDTPGTPLESRVLDTAGDLTIFNFQESYLGAAAAWADMLQGDFVSSVRTIANYCSKWTIGMNNSKSCDFFATSYTMGQCLSAPGDAAPGSYVASFDTLGVSGSSAALFAYSGSTITASGGQPGFTLAVDDQFMPTKYSNLTGLVTAPPAEVSAGTIYWVVATPTSSTFQISATQGGSPISFSTSPTGCGGYYLPSPSRSCPATGTVTTNTTDPDNELSLQMAPLGLNGIRGVSGAATAWGKVKARNAANYNAAARWFYQPTL